MPSRTLSLKNVASLGLECPNTHIPTSLVQIPLDLTESSNFTWPPPSTWDHRLALAVCETMLSIVEYPEYVLMSGVCAGLNEKVILGDIIVAKSAISMEEGGSRDVRDSPGKVLTWINANLGLEISSTYQDDPTRPIFRLSICQTRYHRLQRYKKSGSNRTSQRRRYRILHSSLNARQQFDCTIV